MYVGNIITFIQYGTYDICPGPVFWWEFNGGVHFVIRLTIFGNFFVLYVCICIINHFSVRIQLQQWLCHPNTIFENIWYGHHQASFFSANSTVRVIMSSGHCIWKNMIWSSSGIIFQCEFSCKGDYVIQALYIWKNMIWSSSGIIFQCEFNCKGDYVIRTLYLRKYDMVIIRHHFSVRIQL